MYIKPETGEVFVDHSAIRSALSHVIFAASITTDDLAFVGVYPVEQVPSGAAPHQTAVQGNPELVDGVWRQTWTLRPATAEELAARAPSVPQVVPKLNARLVLIDAGYWADVVAFATEQGETALAYLEDALTMRRDNALVNAWAASRGKVDELDGLFISAGALNA